MEDLLTEQLKPGETLTERRRIHAIVLFPSVFFLVVGILQFTPWSFGTDTAWAGGVALAYAAFSGAIFWSLVRDAQVALTDQRVIYLQRFFGRAPDVKGWGPLDFDTVMVRKGVLGGPLGYGHLMLLKSGRLVTVVRAVRDLDSLVPRIESELLKR